MASPVLPHVDSQAEHQTEKRCTEVVQNSEKTSKRGPGSCWNQNVKRPTGDLDLGIAAPTKSLCQNHDIKTSRADLILYRSGLRRELQGNFCNMLKETNL